MFSLLFLACTPSEKNPETTEVPTESHISIDELTNEECQDVSGTPVPGAAVYFSGTFSLADDTLKGIEKAFFVANDTWSNGDCEVTLNLIGGVTDPVNCSACDIAFAITATMDEANSDCPEELQVDYESYSTTYNVQRLGDGTANWFFESGNQFATGIHEDGYLDYLSDFQCQWY